MSGNMTESSMKTWCLRGISLSALAALSVTGLATPAVAQDPPGAALARMEGAWQGEGWIMAPSRERHTFDIFEEVEVAAGGHAVVLRGEGFAPAGSGRQGRPIHDAVGLLTRAGEGYEMRALTQHGQQNDAEFIMTEAGFDWSIDLGPGGRIQYSAQVTDSVWEETGEWCPADGGQCWPTFYMRLERAR